MIENLKKIYMQGFEEDGEKYAEYFCNKNAKYSVVYPEDKPVSAGYILPKKLSNGKMCAYFSALATLLDERGKGKASALIKNMLIEASKKYSFAVLSPFNSIFYRKYGFFTTQFCQKTIINGDEILIEKELNFNDLIDVNNLFSSSIKPLIDSDYLNYIIEESSLYGAKPILLKQKDKTIGFCVKEKTSISRVLTKDLDISKIANFNGFTYKKQTEYGDAFIQIRIVSVEKFAEFLTPLREFSISIYIEDDIVQANEGAYVFESKNNKITAAKIDNNNFTKVNISNLVDYFFDNKYIEKFKTQFIDEY